MARAGQTESERCSENSGTGSCPPVATRQHKGNGKSNGSRGTSLIEPARVTTDFAALPDGTFLELVRPKNSAWNELKFLTWNAGTSSIVDWFEHDGRLLVPPRLDERLHRNLNLQLPAGVGDSFNARFLFVWICNFIREFVGLPEASICLTAAFVLSTWFVDKLSFAPYLCICGPQGSGKTTLLRVLHWLCRRSVLMAGPIAPAICSLPALLRPTLLFDELRFCGTDKAQTFECWLRAGNSPGFPVAMGGQLVDGFGAKVLCSRQPVVDTALASRALHISMVPTNDKPPLWGAEEILDLAAMFQSWLLTFRLLHYREFEPRSFHVPFTPRMRSVAGALLLPFTEDQETVVESFKRARPRCSPGEAERA